jgi:hypothetical protein
LTVAYTSSVFSTTFTPPRAGVIEVLATFESAGHGASYRAGVASALYFIQSGVTTYSLSMPITNGNTTYARYVQRFRFQVAAGVSCTVGLVGDCSGAYTLNWRNIRLTGSELQAT